MTLPEACAVLNARKHDGWDQWAVDEGPHPGGYSTGPRVVGYDPYANVFTPFEAIAIAEKYARETPKAIPDSAGFMEAVMREF